MTLALVAALLAFQDEEGGLACLKWIARHQGADGAWGPGCRDCDCLGRGPAPEAVKRDAAVEKRAKPLIDALGAETPDEREKATADLQAMGRAIEPYLEDAIAAPATDAETRIRAESILKRVRPRVPQPDLELTSLNLLGFLGAGYSHLSKDTYEGICTGEVVKKTLQWLLNNQSADGAIGPAPADGVTTGNLLAATALSEAYGLTGSMLFKEQAQRAVDWVVSRQRESGAWGAGKDEALPTLWALFALRSAELSELTFPRKCTAGLLPWLRANAEKGDGLATASAVLAQVLVEKKKDGLDASLTRLSKLKPADLDPLRRNIVTYALFLADGPGGAHWKSWNEPLKESIVPAQRRSPHCDRGSWGEGATRARDTAFHTLTLEVYYRYPSVFGQK